MLILLFYLIIVLLVAITVVYVYRRRQARKYIFRRRESSMVMQSPSSPAPYFTENHDEIGPVRIKECKSNLSDDKEEIIKVGKRRVTPGIKEVIKSETFKKVDEQVKIKSPRLDDLTAQSPYDPNVIVLQINASIGKAYMGYELHQALLSAGLRFGEMNIFHRYEQGDRGNILFGLAAATVSGGFIIEDIGSFKCESLLLFMRLESKKRLMASFDLMLDTARQLVEELGGEIYDDLSQPINAGGIKRLREKICMLETSNLYVSDLFDHID